MSQPDTTEPARIHVKQFNGRTWVAQAVDPDRQGAGFAWGAALAALDYYSHAHTDGRPPLFYLDIVNVRALRTTCTQLGVPIRGFVPSVA
jgi:hypothetical protein